MESGVLKLHKKYPFPSYPPLNGVFHFMESYWSHYGVFNHFQLEKNEFSVVLMEFCFHIMATLWSF